MPSRLYKEFIRHLGESEYIRIKIWEVAPAVLGSRHNFKYSMAYVVDGVCVMCYDNERGKGDHKHIGAQEISTHFVSIEQLIADFLHDVESIRRGA
ncbi:TPA: toxin-antitoxin system TumE family protein [Escherichia coli]